MPLRLEAETPATESPLSGGGSAGADAEAATDRAPEATEPPNTADDGCGGEARRKAWEAGSGESALRRYAAAALVEACRSGAGSKGLCPLEAARAAAKTLKGDCCGCDAATLSPCGGETLLPPGADAAKLPTRMVSLATLPPATLTPATLPPAMLPPAIGGALRTETVGEMERVEALYLLCIPNGIWATAGACTCQSGLVLTAAFSEDTCCFCGCSCTELHGPSKLALLLHSDLDEVGDSACDLSWSASAAEIGEHTSKHGLPAFEPLQSETRSTTSGATDGNRGVDAWDPATAGTAPSGSDG